MVEVAVMGRHGAVPGRVMTLPEVPGRTEVRGLNAAGGLPTVAWWSSVDTDVDCGSAEAGRAGTAAPG